MPVRRARRFEEANGNYGAISLSPAVLSEAGRSLIALTLGPRTRSCDRMSTRSSTTHVSLSEKIGGHHRRSEVAGKEQLVGYSLRRDLLVVFRPFHCDVLRVQDPSHPCERKQGSRDQDRIDDRVP